MYTNMLCCERKWWDFVSYCPPDIAPELPDEFRMFRKRLVANAGKFAEIEEAATATIEHVVERMEKLRAMYPHKGAPKSKLTVDLERSVIAAEMSEQEAYHAAVTYIDRIEVTP